MYISLPVALHRAEPDSAQTKIAIQEAPKPVKEDRKYDDNNEGGGEGNITNQLVQCSARVKIYDKSLWRDSFWSVNYFIFP